MLRNNAYVTRNNDCNCGFAKEWIERKRRVS